MDRPKTLMELDDYYREFYDKVPFIKWPAEWSVKAIPPFSGALVRYVVVHQGARVSIYLDGNNSLGYWGGPYWEVYPYDEDVFRCDMDDTKSLVEAVRVSLLGQQPLAAR